MVESMCGLIQDKNENFLTKSKIGLWAFVTTGLGTIQKLFVDII